MERLCLFHQEDLFQSFIKIWEGKGVINHFEILKVILSKILTKIAHIVLEVDLL